MPEWIRTTDQQPTVVDANADGDVLVYSGEVPEGKLTNWWYVAAHPGTFTYWKPLA